MRGQQTLVAVIGSIVALLGTTARARAQLQPGSDVAWRYHAASDVKRLRECASAELLITTKDALIAIDATTGTVLWELADLPDLGPGLFWDCRAATGLSYRKDRIVAFDLLSGERQWDASALPPFQEIRGYVVLTRSDMLLLFLRTPASDRSLAALRLSTGELLWRRDDAFHDRPAFSGRGGVSDISEYQVFITDTDTTLIVYVSSDGPIRLDSRSGLTLWTGAALAGRRVPSVREYAAMRVFDSTLIIPHDKGLMALDTHDGNVLWDIPNFLPMHATRLAAVATGVLVRGGRSYVTVLDPQTGISRWPQPLTLATDGVAYEIAGYRYFLVSHDRLMAVDLASGDTTALTDLAFRDGEHAQLMVALGDDLLVASRQNLFRVDYQGAVRYHRFYRAPGAKFFEKLGGISPGAHFGSAAFQGDYGFFVTNAPDSSGRTGNSLVRVLLDGGTEAGRVWFRERAPKYWPDAARDQLLMLEDRRTLAAARFPAAQHTLPVSSGTALTRR